MRTAWEKAAFPHHRARSQDGQVNNAFVAVHIHFEVARLHKIQLSVVVALRNEQLSALVLGRAYIVHQYLPAGGVQELFKAGCFRAAGHRGNQTGQIRGIGV